VDLGPEQEAKLSWNDKPLLIRWLDGRVSFAFSTRSFSAAYAAYPAYPDACIVYALAVPWETRPELAQRVRDRWVQEGFTRLRALTSVKPSR
jgi:hypothetical protein